MIITDNETSHSELYTCRGSTFYVISTSRIQKRAKICCIVCNFGVPQCTLDTGDTLLTTKFHDALTEFSKKFRSVIVSDRVNDLVRNAGKHRKLSRDQKSAVCTLPTYLISYIPMKRTVRYLCKQLFSCLICYKKYAFIPYSPTHNKDYILESI